MVFFFFCTLVNRPMGGTIAPPLGYATAPVTGQFLQFLEKITILKLDLILNAFMAIGKNKIVEIKNLLKIFKLPRLFSPL